MAKKTTKDNTQKAPVQEKTPRMTVADVHTEVMALAETVNQLTALVTSLVNAQNAPKQESKSKKSTKDSKSTKSTKDSKPRKPAPTKEQWLAFKQENADKVAHLRTRHERNSALYKLYMAA